MCLHGQQVPYCRHLQYRHWSGGPTCHASSCKPGSLMPTRWGAVKCMGCFRALLLLHAAACCVAIFISFACAAVVTKTKWCACLRFETHDSKHMHSIWPLNAWRHDASETTTASTCLNLKLPRNCWSHSVSMATSNYNAGVEIDRVCMMLSGHRSMSHFSW